MTHRRVDSVALLPMLTVLAGACLVLALSAAAPRNGARPASAHRGNVKRGEYLVTVLGCNDCHTPGYFYGAPDMSRMLSGSELGWQGPWGVTYARNLTPDKATGVGNWTEDDIVKAIRTGMRANGQPIFPPMPVPDFAHLTDEDAYSVAAFLKTIPAITHKLPDRLTPGQTPTGAVLVIPPPPAWDAPKGAEPPPPGK